MEWLNNLQAVFDYIEDNLDKGLSLEKIAQIACCSPDYFQRIFTHLFGISLSKYIRLRKMSQAAFLLQRTESKVIDVALKYGYSSPTAFNRAFKKVHGITPLAAKNIGVCLKAYPPIKLTVTITGNKPLSYRLVKKDRVRIIGYKIAIDRNMDANMQKIPLFWKELFNNGQIDQLVKLSNGKIPGILGISVYNDGDSFYYCIGVSSDNAIDSNMIEYEISDSMYVVFENDGLFKEDVQSIFKRFLSEFLPLSNYRYAYNCDVEVYPMFFPPAKQGHFEVWMAIKKIEEDQDVSFNV